MSHDAEKRAEEMLHKLRKLKGFCPMSPEEADAAYEAAPADQISDEEIDSMIDFVTSGGRASWDPTPDLGWIEESDLEVEDDALQLHRNKGEDKGDTAAEDKLREELLNDEEDEDGVDGGEEPPAEGQ